jgi:glycosyltransferase involved in cell wall biosynthesis
MNISTVIPVYVENSFQLELMSKALDSILMQTTHPLEVIICDNSTNPKWVENIKKIIDSKKLKIFYFSNRIAIGAANNTNYGVGKTNGELIHVLHQDDYIVDTKLYEQVSNIFSQTSKIWLIAQGKVGDRIMYSKFDSSTKFGFNELGGPSSLFVLKENFIYANPNYRMLYDVVNYHEYFLKMGSPYILRGVNIQFSVHEHQLSNKISSREVLIELSSFLKEYKIHRDEIKLTINAVKREIHHQRLLLLASLLCNKISIQYFILNFSISYLKSIKRRVFN